MITQKLKCRIDSSDFYNGNHYTYVSTPAPDQYSSPASFKLLSDKPLGNKGDEIEPTVSISGFVRQKRYKDKNTGEMKTFMEDVTFLKVVESQPSVVPVTSKAS